MDTITNYTIKSELGQGGMATVYLAEDKKFLTNVAVKVLAKEFAHNENIRKRFLAEARNMFKMSHPNIIKVSDLIDEGDTVAFVMEYIEGETLKDYLERKGKLNDEEIKTIFTQMLAAVGYVHEQGLIHRDIKPSNFMISPKGQVKLLDFGIAKNTDTNSAEYTQTNTSQQMGTPMYMSPEQVNETKSVTAQSDIYSLGVVLWQMVMGQKPYDTKTLSNFQLQSKIVNETLALTHTNWDTRIQKATHKNLESRYTSTHLFLNDLQNPESIKDDKTIFEKNDDKTIFEKNDDKTVFVNKISDDATQIQEQVKNTSSINAQKPAIESTTAVQLKTPNKNLFKALCLISIVDALISLLFHFINYSSYYGFINQDFFYFFTFLISLICNITLFISLILLLKLNKSSLKIYLVCTILIIFMTVLSFLGIGLGGLANFQFLIYFLQSPTIVLLLMLIYKSALSYFFIKNKQLLVN